MVTRSAVVHRGPEVHQHHGLAPGTDHEIDGIAFRTLPDLGERLCTFATVNDVHFGEVECGLIEGMPDAGEVFRSAPGEPPYPQTMNRGAAAEIAAVDPALVVVKGDLTSNGLQEEYDEFLDVYGTAFGDRLLHVRGNHESYHDLLVASEAVQQRTLPGVTVVLLDTSVSQREYGAVSAAQLDQLDAIAADADRPVLVMGHHHAWNPGSAERPERYFGIQPEDSERLVDLVARRPSIIGVFAGHTHRNRVRHFAATGAVPWVEVSAVKDYPGAWAEYRVHEAGIAQVFHRVSSPEALAWTERTRGMFHGLYASYAFGAIDDRCFVMPSERAA